MIEIGVVEITIGIAIMIGTVSIATKTAGIIAGANTPALALPANPTGTGTIEIVKTTGTGTPAALQTKEAATITLPTLADIDHDISLKRTY